MLIVPRILGWIVDAGSRFRRGRDGVAALEFALIAPVLIVLLGGACDFSGAMTTANRATYVAEGIAQMISQTKDTVDSSTMGEFIRTAPLLDPDILAYARRSGTTDLTKAVNVVVSSVVFIPKVSGCIDSCEYDAQTVFSTTVGGWSVRPCGALGAGTGSLSKLPKEAFGPSPLVVVDVEMFYRPLMSIFLPSSMSFKRTAFFRPRNVQRINSTSNCSGY